MHLVLLDAQTFRLRDYEPSDLDAVLRLNLDALETAAARDAAAVIEEFFPELRDIPSDYQQTGAFVVGVEDGEIIAMGGVQRLDDETYEIMRMRVAIPQRGRGYGRDLLHALEKRARDRGAKRIVLKTATDLAAAIRLYESEGYVETHRTRGEYSIGSVEIVHYEKRLGMRLRDFEPRDLAAVLQLDIEALDPDLKAFAKTARHPDLEDVPGIYQEHGVFLVGDVGGELMAIGGLLPAEAGRLKMRRIRIAEAHQRRGYARQLVEELERRAVSLGATSIFLDTTVQQVAAQRLYESLDYTLTHRSTVIIEGRDFTVVNYEKRLS